MFEVILLSTTAIKEFTLISRKLTQKKEKKERSNNNQRILLNILINISKF